MGKVTCGMGMEKPRPQMVRARNPAYLNQASRPSPAHTAKSSPAQASRGRSLCPGQQAAPHS